MLAYRLTNIILRYVFQKPHTHSCAWEACIKQNELGLDPSVWRQVASSEGPRDCVARVAVGVLMPCFWAAAKELDENHLVGNTYMYIHIHTKSWAFLIMVAQVKCINSGPFSSP